MVGMSAIVRQLKREGDRAEKQLKAMDAALTAFATIYQIANP
jgi:hypothetical protein